ncbi:MAG: hypothetical protein RL095_831 [Verrucomicrobiota bacterium]|jgi:hypothetical protein
MTIHRIILLLVILLPSCVSPLQQEGEVPDRILIFELCGAPDGDLAWLAKDQGKLPLPALRQFCRQAVWIEVAPSPKRDLSSLWETGRESGCVPACFGESPAKIPAASWILSQPPPRRALPAAFRSGLPQVTLAERRPGMTAAIEVPMTRPYLLQLGDGAAQFCRQMALDERPWIARVHPGDWVAQDPEPDALERARRVLPGQAPALAAWMLQDDMLARLLAELVAIEQDRHTLVVVCSSDPASPLLVYWPGRIEGGERLRSSLDASSLLQQLGQQVRLPSQAAGLSSPELRIRR